MNAMFTFVAGLVWLGVAFHLQEQGIDAIAVVGVFFMSLFFLVPLTLLQMPDDAFLLGPISKRFRGGSE